MRTWCPLLVLAGLCLATAPAAAQQHTGFARWSVMEPAVDSMKSTAVTVPDSVRRRAGYHHWKGAVIGGAVGSVVGTLLTLAANTQCLDCTITTWDRARAALLFGGGGTVFGFLVGAASPRYVWEAAPDASGAGSPGADRAGE